MRPSLWLGTALVLLALAAPVLAATGRQFNSPTLLFETPTADVLPTGALAISADMTFPLTKTSMNVDYPELNANLRFSPIKRLDFALTAYTFEDNFLDAIEDIVLDVRYQFVGGDPGRFGLAVGVYDVGFHEYVSPIGHDTANVWPDWKYRLPDGTNIRTTERFSAFAVASIPVTQFARLHVGLGRGRFVGHDGFNDYLNTDIFFDEHHQWAIGLLGGVEVFVSPNIALIAEADSRDLNSGVRVNYGPLTATVAWTKMEGLLIAKGEPEGVPKFGRLAVGVAWQVNNLSGLAAIPRLFQRPERVPLEPLPPPPEPGPVPPGPAPIPVPSLSELKLEPIWFDWDKWEITSEAAATLRRNADVILAHPRLIIVVTGYASEEGSTEHNLPLSARRAYAAVEHLKSLGVPGKQLRFRALGESIGRPYPQHRAVYFEIEK